MISQVPTVCGISLSVMTIISSSRTTVCDIMCTTNTERSRTRNAAGSQSDVPFVRFPYQKQETILSKGKKGKTQTDIYRFSAQQQKKSQEFIKERNQFLLKLHQEREDKLRRETASAVKIQSIFRGYNIRKPTSYKPRSTNKPEIFGASNKNIMELHEELCALAESLSLKPIPGLTLENRSKKSRRRTRIELAAIIRIQSFVRMSLAIIKTRNLLEKQRRLKQERMACKIQKFFRWVRKKAAKMVTENKMRMRAAIKLQCRFRIFSAKLK